MLATVCTLTATPVLQDGRCRAEGGGRRERRTGVEQLVPSMIISMSFVNKRYLSACAEMSGTPRPSGLHRSQIKNRSGEVIAASALVEPGILVAEVLEEGGHRAALVAPPRKDEREAAPGEVCRDLWFVAGRAADASDTGTCENVAVW